MDDINFKQLWVDVIEHLRPFFSNENIFNECILTSKVYKFINNKLIVIVNSIFAKSIFLNDYKQTVEEFLNTKTKTNLMVDFICENEINLYNYDNELIETKPTNEQTGLYHQKSNGLLEEYTFDNFIVGEFNKNVYNAVTAIADKLGKIYNPLFIYGSTGLGKTHLITALGNNYLSKFPQKKVKYIECDNFVREVINAMSKGSSYIEELKDYYSSIDLLLIDDIQFLCGKDKTNETFFQIFNCLVKNNRQIVITSDKAPDSLELLEERMVSRFNSGLTLKINKPDIDSLKRIIIDKLKDIDSHLIFNDEAINELVKYYNNDLRKLIGILNQISFYAIQNLKPDEVITKSFIEEFLTNNTNISISVNAQQINPEMIISIVCKWYSIKEELIKGKSRLKSLVTIRHICMYIMRNKLNLSYSEIGHYFNNRDHTTVMNGIEKITKQINDDETLSGYLNKILSKI